MWQHIPAFRYKSSPRHKGVAVGFSLQSGLASAAILLLSNGASSSTTIQQIKKLSRKHGSQACLFYLHCQTRNLQLTQDQILALAPDEASKKAGLALSSPSKWVSHGMNEQAIWGECQGSGSKPYQTQIDLGTTSFKCSCPSRKFPCKHGLGLLLLQVQHHHLFSQQTAPDWVADWLNKRIEKAEKKAEQSSKPIDEAAQSKRLQAREQLIEDGIEELHVWIKDLLRTGLIALPEKGTAQFYNMSKRMIDAKAPGLAAMVKGLGNINFYKEGWQHIFMQQLCHLYLVTMGFQNKEQLAPLLQEDIKTAIGFTQTQEQLKAQAGIADTWLVLAKKTTEDEGVVTERNWLLGLQTQQTALVLQFIVRGQGIQFTLTPGTCIQANLAFFQASVPTRAIILQHQLLNANTAAIPTIPNWQALLALQAQRWQQLPFATHCPYVIEKLALVYENQQWYLVDQQQEAMLLQDNYAALHSLLAITGGAHCTMVVMGNHPIYEPLAVWVQQQYFTL